MHYQPLVPNCPPPGYPMPHLPSPFPSKAFSSSSHGDKGTSSSWVTPETASMNAAGSIVDSFKMPGVSQPLPPSFIPSSYWPAGSIPTANPAHIPPGAMAMHPGQVMGAGGGGIGANEDGIQVGAFYPSYYPRILVQPLLPPTSTMISQPSSSPASAMSSTSMSTSLATTFPCTVLGKRAVEGEQQQESEPDNRACGLNLLFAAVNSLEANFS
ncbi:hypothetical protein EON65_01105 [archaeon]|nr:MAG: hypothetical protein EON65_01105 [archaeon]